MEKIDLKSYNRYREEVYLDPISENKYRLISPYNYRVIFNEDGKTIYALDPSGGPFLSVGSVIQNKKIKSISQTGILELENDTTNNKS